MKGLLSIAFVFLCWYLIGQTRTLTYSTFHAADLNQRWIIVKYRPEVAMPSKAQAIHAPQTSQTASILDGIVKIPINAEEDPIQACNRLLANSDVIYAEPIVANYLLQTPADPFLEDQYYLDNIRAFDAWDITRGDDDIAIAVIDSGTDLDHDDLQDNLWTNVNDPIDGIDNDNNGFVDDFFGYDFSDADNDPSAGLDDHGTIVAGVAGAIVDNNIGIAGVGYNTKIATLKGFSSIDGEGIGLFDAILYAADNGIEILNLSWGGIRAPLQSEQDIINYAVLEKGVVIVAAAGNDGNMPTREEKFYPASYGNVLSVGGSIADDSKWSGSTFNHAVDLIAPAAGIFSTSTNNGYNPNGTGTSFAAPMVAATAALVKAQFPNLTAPQIMERVRVTADDIYSVPGNSAFEGKLGRGRLNAFRAVSEGNLKSLRAEQVTVSKSANDPIFFGDTLQIALQLTNYLSPVVDPTVYLSSPSDQFTSTSQSFFPGSIGTLQNEALTFEIVLSKTLTPETNVDVRLDFQDGSYTDFQFIDIETAPDHASFGNDNMVLPIAGDGRLGILDYNNQGGGGLMYQSDTLARHLGILLAASEIAVSDNIISDFDSPDRENDFQTQAFYKIAHHPFADRFGGSTFTDEANNLLVEQSNITSDGGDFTVHRYRIINTGSDTLHSLSLGAFVDWDLEEPSENSALYDLSESYLFARSSSSSLFAGTKLLGDGAETYSAIDLNSFNGNTPDIGTSFSDQEKYQLLTLNKMEAGSSGTGNDVATLHGITVNQLPPNEYRYVDVIMAIGSSQAELTEEFNEATAYLTAFLNNPQVLETVVSCDGGDTRIDPQGELFIFYEDPLGQLPIDTTDSFSPGPIAQDTSFYVRNLDLGYPSEIYEVRVQLTTDFAAFDMSTDTLYLDNPTTNIINFSDLSTNATTWLWDFGEGTRSSLQNPTISFGETGTFSINLFVENEFGCTDSFSRTLIVAQRPVDLVFEPITICPEETITLSNESTSKLFLYTSPTQVTPVATGASVEIGPISMDSTFYVAGLVNDFLTNRTPVEINVSEVPAGITILPDTLTTAFQLKAEAIVEEGATVNWMINGLLSGSTKEIAFPANQGLQVIELQVEGENGCQVIQQSLFEVSTSPTPEVEVLTGCQGSETVLKPQNGTYFGFYEDAALTNLIAKGTQLNVNQAQEVFVVGLDDGLPGTVVGTEVTFESFKPTITFTASRVGDRNRVEFGITSESPLATQRWYTDGTFAEVVPDPTFFFGDSVVEIILETTSLSGCENSDTLLLDFTPPMIPLAISEEFAFQVYPNPTSDQLSLQTAPAIQEVVLMDLSGNVLLRFDRSPQSIDLSTFDAGLYLLKLTTDDFTQKVKIVRE